MYELTYIVSPILDETSLNETAAAVRDFVSDLNARIKKEQLGEKRKLAYPIKKQLFGYYVTLEFDLEPEKIAELENYLKNQNDILRSLLLSLDEAKLHPAPAKARVQKTEAAAPVKTPFKTEKSEKIKIEELNKKLEEILEE